MILTQIDLVKVLQERPLSYVELGNELFVVSELPETPTVPGQSYIVKDPIRGSSTALGPIVLDREEVGRVLSD